MPRYEIKGDPISIAYGYDDVLVDFLEVFLSVFDSRLEWKKNASAQVNSVSESLTCGMDGSGCYFGLTTSPIGLGLKVNKDTIRVYLKRFGVPEHHIKSILKGEPIIDTPEAYGLEKVSASLDIKEQQTESTSKSFCVHCKVNNGSKKCSRCRVACYCGRDCQLKDWPVHKFFCGSLPFPRPLVKTSEKTVRAVYLPELTGDPVLINLPITNKYDEDEDVSFESADLEDFLGKDYGYGRNWMPINPLKPSRVIADTIEFRWRENFGSDGSKLNESIQKITQNCSFFNWKGPMVVTRYRGKGAEGDYLDLEICDFLDIVDYFKWYGTKAIKDML